MLTLTEAAKALGIRVRTMREWIKLGKIHAEKAENGWYWMIPEEEIVKHDVGKDRGKYFK